MKVIRPLILILAGGLLYLLIEILFRGYSHWTMFIVGGLCFYFVGLINETSISWDMSIWLQAFIGMCVITAVEFISGFILNIWLGLGIWDYSDLPFNLFGQICLPFSIAWYFISIPAIVLDDWLRYLMGEEKPHYTLKNQY